jgi:hypothetical protein
MPDDPCVEILNVMWPGVTQPHLDSGARRSWLAAVHDSMRATGGAVTTAVEAPIAGRNYYQVGVELRAGAPLNMLFNAAADLVAAAKPQDFHSVAAVFVDVPGGDHFRQAGLQVADAVELDQQLNEGHLLNLTENERWDVAYHRPSRLGDLLFNWFD